MKIIKNGRKIPLDVDVIICSEKKREEEKKKITSGIKLHVLLNYN